MSKTWRFKIKGIAPNDNGIVVFWHGLMLPCWKLFTNCNPYGVVSTSKDGELLVALMDRWGYSFIRGSSSKGGKEVLEKIIEKSKTNLVLITPDGPRGPNRKFKAGAVVAAQRAQVSLYYLIVKINSKLMFNKSWDKFEFPLPFSRIEIEISNPIIIEKEVSRDSIDRIINEIENKMV